MRIDREPGLDVGGAEVAVAVGGHSEARILVPGEVAYGPRRLPVDLVDDLLDVAPDQRLEQGGEAGIEAHRVERGAVVGGPLHHLHQRSAGPLRDFVEEIAVAEAAAVRDPLGMDGVDLRADRGDLPGAEETADDRVAVAMPGGRIDWFNHRPKSEGRRRPVPPPTARWWSRR